jgi:hypothetical protein
METEHSRIVRRRVKIRKFKKRDTDKSFFYKKLVFGKTTSLYYWEVTVIAAILLVLFSCILFLLVTATYDLPTDLEDYRG